MNATADDWESLEQICPVVDRWWQPTEASVVADEMMGLLRAGLLEVMPVPPDDAAAVLAEPVAYWFRITPAGRAWWHEQSNNQGKGSSDQPP